VEHVEINVPGNLLPMTAAARAEQPMPVIGFLNNTSPEIRRVELAAFQRGLNETGYFDWDSWLPR
jgi:hypothetical protein